MKTLCISNKSIFSYYFIIIIAHFLACLKSPAKIYNAFLLLYSYLCMHYDTQDYQYFLSLTLTYFDLQPLFFVLVDSWLVVEVEGILCHVASNPGSSERGNTRGCHDSCARDHDTLLSLSQYSRHPILSSHMKLSSSSHVDR